MKYVKFLIVIIIVCICVIPPFLHFIFYANNYYDKTHLDENKEYVIKNFSMNEDGTYRIIAVDGENVVCIRNNINSNFVHVNVRDNKDGVSSVVRMRTNSNIFWYLLGVDTYLINLNDFNMLLDKKINHVLAKD